MTDDLEKLQEGYRIIIVEDEEPQLELWSLLLQEVIQEFPSMWIHTFKNAEDAYKSIIDDNHVALMIVDYHLSDSGMSGYSLFKRLRSKGKEFPFCVVSGDKTALETIKERNVLTLTKPLPQREALVQEMIGIIKDNQAGIFRSHIKDEIGQVKNLIKDVKNELTRHTEREEEFQKLILDKFKDSNNKVGFASGFGKFVRALVFK